MLRRIGGLLSSNVLGLIALFLALGGGVAYALPGVNTVNSGDIINNQVKGADIDESTLAPSIQRRCAKGTVAGYAQINTSAAITATYATTGVVASFNCKAGAVTVRTQGAGGSYRVCFPGTTAVVATAAGVSTSVANDNIVTWSKVDDTAAGCATAFQVNTFDQTDQLVPDPEGEPENSPFSIVLYA
jgi:hypothetical protein